jgi:uncharacterized damage-inducible protein DinB
MYSPAALLDIHARTHRAFAALLAHAAGFPQEDLDRAHPSFGGASLRLQIAHAIGAERYWVGVLDGVVDAEEREEQLPTIAELEGARVAVADATRRRLLRTTEAELDTPREMETFGGNRVSLVPAHVHLRTMTHVFHHMGQCASICRILGRPVSGLDFPLR